MIAFFNDLGVTAKYLYDFGDSWWHKILLEGYLLKDDKIEYPVCLDGERSCPPEDCGGVPGYYKLLRVLSDPNNEEYEARKHGWGRNGKLIILIGKR